MVRDRSVVVAVDVVVIAVVAVVAACRGHENNLKPKNRQRKNPKILVFFFTSVF